MRRSLRTTTAIATSIALAIPLALPVSAQVQRPADIDESICAADMSQRDCRRAVRQARQELRQELRAQRQQGGAGGQAGDRPAGQVPGQAPAQGQAQDQAPAQGQGQVPAQGQGQGQGQRQGQAQAQGQAQGQGQAQTQPQAEEPRAQARPQPESVEDLQGMLGGDGDNASQEPARRAPDPQAEPSGTLPPEVQQSQSVEQAGDGSVPQGQSQSEAQRQPQRRPQAGGGESAAAQAAAGGQGDQSMAASGGDNGAVEETTETVTEDSVRRSDETFDEARERRRARRAERRAQAQEGSQGDGTAGQQVRDRNDDDDGIPDFLTGAVVGAAGALIVGSLLDDNREVVSTSDDRVVVRDQYGDLQVLRDDDAILRQPGSEVTTRRYQDGSSETIVTQPDGGQVVTVRNDEGRVVKRVVVAPDGRRTVLFDDTVTVDSVDVNTLPEPNRTAAPQVDPGNEDALRAALLSETRANRSFSLNQVRQIDRVRYLAPAVQVENITFETGSAAISPTEAQELLALGELMTGMIADNPNEVFLIEGHTDAVGSDVSNLTLSDRRAESVARALTEYFGVSPANMVLQGYGESDLRIQTDAAERENRRVVVRRITPLLQTAQLQ